MLQVGAVLWCSSVFISPIPCFSGGARRYRLSGLQSAARHHSCLGSRLDGRLRGVACWGRMPAVLFVSYLRTRDQGENPLWNGLSALVSGLSLVMRGITDPMYCTEVR